MKGRRTALLGEKDRAGSLLRFKELFELEEELQRSDE